MDEKDIHFSPPSLKVGEGGRGWNGVIGGVVLLDYCCREISSLYLLITWAISILCWNKIIRFGVFVFQIMLLVSIATKPVLRCVNWEESGVCVIIWLIWGFPYDNCHGISPSCLLLPLIKSWSNELVLNFLFHHEWFHRLIIHEVYLMSKVLIWVAKEKRKREVSGVVWGFPPFWFFSQLVSVPLCSEMLALQWVLPDGYQILFSFGYLTRKHYGYFRLWIDF